MEDITGKLQISLLDGKNYQLQQFVPYYNHRLLLPLLARHKSCFLRADTGPCRADIIQWYFDAKQKKCYRFFWGGCQGNGNRFESKERCLEYCKLNTTGFQSYIPHYCSVSFDYGNCFGHFYRWGWDKFSKTCKRYMYSGCGATRTTFTPAASVLITASTLPTIHCMVYPTLPLAYHCTSWA